MGSSVRRRPMAFLTALATAASGGTIGTSPTPAHAVRVLVVGHLDHDGLDHRQVAGDRHAVVEEARVIELAVGVEDALLVDGPADALGDAALDLALDVAWMDRPADVLERRVADDLHPAGLGVDLHVADVRAEPARRAFGVERRARTDRAAGGGSLLGQLANDRGSNSPALAPAGRACPFSQITASGSIFQILAARSRRSGSPARSPSSPPWRRRT